MQSWAGVLAGAVLFASSCDAFNVVTAPLHARTATAKLDAVRAQLRPSPAERRGALGLQAGVYGVIDYKHSKRPEKPEATKCACGSGMPYSKCCEEWHDRGEAVDPLILIKSRYSAFAYRLPEYIIATTQKNGPEWMSNQEVWETELLEFMDTYEMTSDSRRLGCIVEACKYDGEKEASVLFKALMRNKEESANALVEIWEKSSVVREGNYWVYKRGSLQEYAGPLA